MVFIVGPRQVGKTWIAKELAKGFERSVYLNYDNLPDREMIKKMSWAPTTQLVIFDELHKMNGWKNYIKGVYDTKPSTLRILVTGSASLQTHKKIGDSLAGRYFVHTILPLSLSELPLEQDSALDENVERLIERGGFPEPFLAELKQDADRWRTLYTESLIRTDVLNFASVEDVGAMQEVFALLRGSIGSPVSYSSIARVVGISPITVRRYIRIFESLFLIFVIRPYTKKISRAILKEPKIYFFDTGLVLGDAGAQFENFVAVSLLKDVLGKNEVTGQQNALAYLRTKEGKEVDFVLVDSAHNLDRLIEVKVSDRELSAGLKYFKERNTVDIVQLVQHLRNDQQLDSHIRIMNAGRYLQRPVL